MARAQLKEVCDVSWGDTTVTKASYVAAGYPAYSASGCDGFLPYFDHDGPGIVLSAIGAQCGKTWFARGKWSCIKNTIYIKSRSAEADTRYVFYALSDPNLWPKRGAAQPFISQTDARNVEIPLPPVPIQQRIAGILSTYDDLIENSQRRIKILDSMTRALYREWFVQFRFPGHESHPRVASPLGEIPQGWSIRRIDEALRFESGKTIKKEERESGDTPVFGANGIIGGTSNPPMAERCIIMGKIGSCGALHRSHVPCWVTNNAFLVAPAVIQSNELAWQVLLDIDFRQYIGGAANPYMPINSFGQHEVVIAPASLQKEFETKTGPLRRLVEALSDSVRNLRRTRDLLIPRLLSGQIDVETA